MEVEKSEVQRLKWLAWGFGLLLLTVLRFEQIDRPAAVYLLPVGFGILAAFLYRKTSLGVADYIGLAAPLLLSFALEISDRGVSGAEVRTWILLYLAVWHLTMAAIGLPTGLGEETSDPDELGAEVEVGARHG